MKPSFLSEANRVEKWCLRNGRIEDANFLTLIQISMENNEKITPEQTVRLRSILSLYMLDVDLSEKIKERMRWWMR